MKKLYILLFILASSSAYGQISFSLFSFADSSYRRFVDIDTADCKRNDWQVGKPHKTVFTSGYYGSRSMVTDTTHPYTSIDTSVFYVKAPRLLSPPLPMPFLCGIQFYYQLDLDSACLAGIDFSADSGHTWKNVLTDATGYFSWPLGSAPDMHHSTTGWQNFSVGFFGFVSTTTDSGIFRFTFVSDSNVSGKDGWIIDGMQFQYYAEGVATTTEANNTVSIFPNPAGSTITIKSTEAINTVAVTDAVGRVMYTGSQATGNVNLNLAGYPAGLYLVSINGVHAGRFVKE